MTGLSILYIYIYQHFSWDVWGIIKKSHTATATKILLNACLPNQRDPQKNKQTCKFRPSEKIHAYLCNPFLGNIGNSVCSGGLGQQPPTSCRQVPLPCWGRSLCPNLCQSSRSMTGSNLLGRTVRCGDPNPQIPQDCNFGALSALRLRLPFCNSWKQSQPERAEACHCWCQHQASWVPCHHRQPPLETRRGHLPT